MSDIRLQRLASLLVNYCTKVQPGEWVGIFGETSAMPALREVFRAVIHAGGHPVLIARDEAMERILLREGSSEQRTWLDPAMTKHYHEADVYIRVDSKRNTRAMSNIPPDRILEWSGARGSWLKTRLNRAARNEMKWVGTLYPTEASAQEANMSLEEYEDFVYGATFCNREDPTTEWLNIRAAQQHKVDWLAGKKTVRCQGPHIDLELSIDGRKFINSDGTSNMPSGEIFTGPVEESVNGWVRFDYPAIVNSNAVSGIELKFENGKVTQASAHENEELLLAQLDTDAGSRYLGEFAIGTNFGITQFTGNTLFDEKIGGTIHMAVGLGYPETGSKNVSAIHWDMICDMRNDSEILVDGELFYKNGEFVV